MQRKVKIKKMHKGTESKNKWKKKEEKITAERMLERKKRRKAVDCEQDTQWALAVSSCCRCRKKVLTIKRASCWLFSAFFFTIKSIFLFSLVHKPLTEASSMLQRSLAIFVPNSWLKKQKKSTQKKRTPSKLGPKNRSKYTRRTLFKINLFCP